MPLHQLLEAVRKYQPEADLSVLERAYRLAARAHAGQMRDSGEPFVVHPVQVALILAELELDLTTLTAALLHDVLEDTPVTAEELEEAFGPDVRRLVDGVTKLNKIHFQSREEHQAQSLRKMFLAMAEDLRVIIIKLADRLHNMRTIRHLPEEKQRKIATETLEIYAPLAHRLGMWAMKWELEDLAFRCLYPDDFRFLVRALAKRRQEREGELRQVMDLLRERLEAVQIKAEVQGRTKNLYSIFTKMKRQGKELGEIYDLSGVRIIVDSVRDCYACLGLVHTLWKPIPGRFKDYVAMPKSNMYQSLHTTVIGPYGEPLEIQIRTWEMHRVVEKGIAADWLYKEGGRHEDFEKKVAWLREVMEWLREMKDPQEFMETLKIDLFEDEVFVFTPKGDVISLPAGATPVDFAFAVHTDIGMRCSGARVNGKMVPLSYQLSNGEFVEIITSKSATPSQDWLHFVKTSKARSKIRASINEARREENLARGRELLEREARKLGLELKELTQSPRMPQVLSRYSLADLDDLMAALGSGRIAAPQVVARLMGREEPKRRRKGAATGNGAAAPGVRVRGADNLLVRLSKCCSPVPGDEIVGYITRGRGVSVHRVDCANMRALPDNDQRRIEVEWDLSEAGPFPVEIEVEAMDRVNLLAQILNSISDGRTNIEAIHTHTTPEQVALINMTVDIHDVEHMNRIMNRIRSVSGVLTVQRARRH